MIQCETKLVKFDVRFYKGMSLQDVELPKDIELTLVYDTEWNENKYIGIGKHIEDAEYNCHRLVVIQFGQYDLFIFDKVCLRDDSITLVDFDEFNKKWTRIFKKFYFHEMYLNIDDSYACGYRQETTKISQFVKFNNDCYDDIIKVAVVGFKCPNFIDVADDSMSIIDVEPFAFMHYPSEQIHCKIESGEQISLKRHWRWMEIESLFAKYDGTPKDALFNQGQIITNGKYIGIFDKYKRSDLTGEINSFYYYDIDTIDTANFVYNDIDSWKLADKEICNKVHKTLAEKNLYYEPNIGKVKMHKNDD